MSKKLSLLIIRFSSIGDLCLTFDFIKAFHSKYSLSLMTYDNFDQVLVPVNHFLSHKHLVSKKNFKHDIKIIKKTKTKYDLILDFQGNIRSLYVRLRFKEVPALNFDKRRIERLIHLRLKKDTYFNHDNLSTRYINENQTFLGEANFHQDNNENKVSLKRIVIAAGASFISKRWPLESFISVCMSILEDSDLREFEIVFIGQKDDQSDRINKFVQSSDRLKSLIGETTISELYTLLGESSLLLTNDSGPMHMGQSVGLSTVAIFGPTHPYFGFVPINKNYFMFDQQIGCRPCSLIGNKKCYREEAFCFTRTSPEQVFSKIKEMVKA